VKTTVQYGNNYVRQRKVYAWVERFKGGRTSDDDDACSGWPWAVTRAEVKKQIDQCIWDN